MGKLGEAWIITIVVYYTCIGTNLIPYFLCQYAITMKIPACIVGCLSIWDDKAVDEVFGIRAKADEAMVNGPMKIERKAGRIKAVVLSWPRLSASGTINIGIHVCAIF